MARTISDIKATITADFMKSTVMATLYGFTVDDSFESTFSKVSFENILFYIVAFLTNTMEKLFDAHKADVDATIAEQKPHTKNWYKNKALAYMHGFELLEDSDQFYIPAETTTAQIAESKIVKYAAVVEKANVLYIKVAAAGLVPLTSGLEGEASDQLHGLNAYFKEVKDAGVKLQIINKPADHFKASLVVYYNPMVLNSRGINASTGIKSVRVAVRDFIASLPFNGEYRNNALIDALQLLDGVVMVELTSAQTSPHEVVMAAQINYNQDLGFTDVDAYVTPESGYMKVYNENEDTGDLQLIYKAYETAGD
jgi:hypothetical protein